MPLVFVMILMMLTHSCIPTHTHTYLSIYMYIAYICICTYINVSVCLPIYRSIYVSISIFTHIYIYKYIYMHTSASMCYAKLTCTWCLAPCQQCASFLLISLLAVVSSIMFAVSRLTCINFRPMSPNICALTSMGPELNP